ncbi:MAG: 3-deoxy-D-manno-octulosonic acid transferase [Desulfobacca sp.]|nr:3-deoxy-D-manno-octulosonic acid transferase [Desulfobacca sp.]
MPLGLFFYNFLTGILFLVGFPFLILYNLTQGKYSDRLVERLGRYPQTLRPDESLPNRRPIWFHAVSVGEVKAAIALIQRIKEQLPDVPLLLSTTTPAGRETAEKLLGNEIPIIYYPLDFYLCVKRAIKFFRPRAFVALETELWPNFLYQAKKSGSKLILVNGRISQRSFKRYSQFRWLFQPLLENFKLLMVRHADDARHFISLGAKTEDVRILGNIKYDGLVNQAKKTSRISLRQKLHLEEAGPVIVAGSTRGGEEGKLLSVFKRLKAEFPGLILIVAPRHISRCPEIESQFQRQGIPYDRYSQIFQSGRPRQEAVILIDRIGDLFILYSLATLVFCGASLVPKGGQNILEPAAWGKPVFYGPYMEDFKDARDLLEKAGAGIPVADETELYERMHYYLEHPEEAAERGEAGCQALKSQTGLTQKAAEMIAEIIKKG